MSSVLQPTAMGSLTTKHMKFVVLSGWFALGCTSGEIQGWVPPEPEAPSEAAVSPAVAATLTFTPYVKINFQPASAATPAGTLADVGAPFADRGNGFSYGWGAALRTVSS